MTQADPSRYALGPAVYAYGVAIDRGGGGLRALAGPALRALFGEWWASTSCSPTSPPCGRGYALTERVGDRVAEVAERLAGELGGW